MNTLYKYISNFIDNHQKLLINASDFIWDVAEIKFVEYKSSSYLINILEENGFRIKKEIADIKTAFVAEYGEGSPHISILGEYDALTNLSQKANVVEEQALSEQNNGHGCGHQLLGVGSLGAVLAIKQLIDIGIVSGTIYYYGCPAEEGGSGKTYMARAGLFDHLDIALTWHPGDKNSVMGGSTLANYQIKYQFKGKSAHAAISPHLGRSALDAVELMNVGVNYLREHIITDARVHYAVTNTGGSSPNIVQKDAEVLYLIRAPEVTQVEEIYQRVNKIAQGAALMTETKVDIIFDKACSNTIPNDALNKIVYENFSNIGIPKYTEDEQSFAKQIRSTLNASTQESALTKRLDSYKIKDKIMSASTDVGDVSWIVPTAQCEVACFALDTPLHSWQTVAQGKHSIAHKGMLHASKVLASTASHLFLCSEKIDDIKEEWINRLNGQTYKCPIPQHVKPPIK